MYKKYNQNSLLILVRAPDNGHIPADEANADYQDFLKWLADENLTIDDLEEYNAPSDEDRQRNLEQHIQQHIDRKAQEKDYDNALSAISYINSSNLNWKFEAQAFAKWRDDVWMKAQEILEEVQAGIRPRPTKRQLIDELPPLNW